MELAKIRNLSDEELLHQEKTTAEQLFRLRFQVSLGQNDGVKKLRELRKEIAQIKTVARSASWAFRGAAQRRAVEAKPAAAGQQEGSPLNDGDKRQCRRRRQRARGVTRRLAKVVSTKMQKTIVVEVEMRKPHPKYKKIVRSPRSSMPTTSRARRGWATWSASARRAR
jgi:large subunit ribosomal protein L29